MGFPILRWFATHQRWWSVVGAGYLVVLVFVIGYFVAARSLDSLGPTAHLAFGALVAAPVAVAFAWDRLRTVRVLGVEITLSDATVELPTLGEEEPEDALAGGQAFSGREEIVRQISRAINAFGRRVLEINLRSHPYWWSTRLYLEAALLVDFSNVRCLVFVEGDAARRYIGTTSPLQVREALAESMPCLEKVYRELVSQDLSVENVIQQWTTASAFDGKREADVKSLVDSGELRALLGQRLHAAAVYRSEHEGALLHYQILNRGERFVAVLLADGRLERVVDADALARRWSLAVLESRLN